jgi:hypothetical protein
MGMKSKLILVLVLVFALSTVASASIITGVDRSYGRSANKPPIGVYDGNTDPLPMDPGGIADGLVIYSDRTYPFINTPAGMLGNEWVRTFNDDKNSGEYDVSYLVTIGEDSPLWIAVDDRLTGSSESARNLSGSSLPRTGSPAASNGPIRVWTFTSRRTTPRSAR